MNNVKREARSQKAESNPNPNNSKNKLHEYRRSFSFLKNPKSQVLYSGFAILLFTF